MTIRRHLYTIVLALCIVLTVGCDRLDDGDDGLVADVLPGEWAFSYELLSDDDLAMEFNYKQVIFRRDSTCAITYIDGYAERLDEQGRPVVGIDGEPVYEPVWGALNGTYQATNSMIRIVSSDFDGTERVLLWRISSLSSRRIVAEYEFEYSPSKFAIAVVTLDKQVSE